MPSDERAAPAGSAGQVPTPRPAAGPQRDPPGGPARRASTARARRPVRDAALRLRPRRRRAPGRRRSGRSCRGGSTSPTRSRRTRRSASSPTSARLGLGADVASGGELATALRAGIAADRIVMTGPGKRDDELLAAVRAGIRAVTVESPGELARLETIAARAERRSPVLLRAAVSEAATLERVRLVGDDGAGKFGMDARTCVACAEHAAGSRPSRAARAPCRSGPRTSSTPSRSSTTSRPRCAAARELARACRRPAPAGRRRRRARDPVRVTRGVARPGGPGAAARGTRQFMVA